jgi:alpha-beta hydrolase superfamily lysophospholipase
MTELPKKLEEMIEEMASKEHQKYIFMTPSEKAALKLGATPWAEWCERLEKELQGWVDGYHEVFCKEDCICDDRLLKEYRTWLEGGEL